MQEQISIQEANKNFSYYIKLVENGGEVVITRHNVPIARLTSAFTQRSLPTKQLQQARARILMLMQEGLALGSAPIDRNSLHDR